MAIREIRLPDGTNLKIDEWIHWPSFSTIEFAAYSKINLRAFSYIAGQQVPSEGLTKRTADDADTNSTVRNRTNQDEALVIYAATYEAFGLSAAAADPRIAPADAVVLAARVPQVSRHNLLALQRSLLFELFVGANVNKPQARVPFSRIPQSVGPVVHGTTIASVAAGPTLTLGAADYGTAGRVSSTNQWRWEIPVYIESDRVFYVKVSSPEGALADVNQDIRLRIWLDGMKRRPVA